MPKSLKNLIESRMTPREEDTVSKILMAVSLILVSYRWILLGDNFLPDSQGDLARAGIALMLYQFAMTLMHDAEDRQKEEIREGKLSMKETLKKQHFNHGGIQADSVDVGPFLFVNANFEDHQYDELKAATENYPNKEKLVFFRFTDVIRFKVSDSDSPSGFRVRYRLPKGEKITSDALYTAEQINRMNFVMIPKESYHHAADLAKGLRQIAPPEFIYAFVQDEIKISIVDADQKPGTVGGDKKDPDVSYEIKGEGKDGE